MRRVGCVLAAVAVALGFVAPGAVTSARQRQLASIPQTVLWAWERPEDLREIGRDTAIAFLAQTITIGDGRPTLVRRRQPLQVPDRARLIAVTRIESPKPKATSLTRDSMQAVVEAISASSRLPLVAAVQIDFDATESQRPLYLTLLADVRQGLGDAVPLSMTALVSWCVHDRWLDRAPVDEIVPMLFRMGPDDGRLRAAATSPTSLDPRCTRAVGVSLDEPIRVVRHNRRVYAFSPRSWTSADVGAIEVRE